MEINTVNTFVKYVQPFIHNLQQVFCLKRTLRPRHFDLKLICELFVIGTTCASILDFLDPFVHELGTCMKWTDRK